MKINESSWRILSKLTRVFDDRVTLRRNFHHGTILLIKGNHDDVGIYRCKEIQASTRLHFLGYQWELWLERNKILLNHYPYLCYAGEHEGVWQLFGHVHSGSDKTGYDIPRLQHLLPFQYDVGVDANSYRPISFYELKEIMGQRNK